MTNRLVKITKAGSDALPNMKGQAKELFTYLLNKYGVENDVDQSELVRELNRHQEDGVVLKVASRSPLSRLYELHRTGSWSKAGYVVVTIPPKPPKPPKVPGVPYKARSEALTAHVTVLENILRSAGIDFPTYAG